MRNEVKAGLIVGLVVVAAVIIAVSARDTDGPGEVLLDNPNSSDTQLASDAKPGDKNPASSDKSKSQAGAPPSRSSQPTARGTTPSSTADRSGSTPTGSTSRVTRTFTPTGNTGDASSRSRSSRSSSPSSSSGANDMDDLAARIRRNLGRSPTADAPATDSTASTPSGTAAPTGTTPTGRTTALTPRGPNTATRTTPTGPTAAATAGSTGDTRSSGATQPRGAVNVPQRNESTTASASTTGGTSRVTAPPPRSTSSSRATGTAKTHTIQRGDYLITIAEQEYGDGKYWKAIQAANPGLNPNALKVGQKIKLPPKAEVLAGATSAAPPKPPVGQMPDYVVERGDSLSSIAGDILKDRNRWKEIYEMNKDKLDSPDQIRVGMKLKVPKLPSD